MREAQPLRRTIEFEDRAALVLILPLFGLFARDIGGHALRREAVGELLGLAERHEDFAEHGRVPGARDAVAAIVGIDHRVRDRPAADQIGAPHRSEEHTSELQSLMRISYAVFCLKKKK